MSDSDRLPSEWAYRAGDLVIPSSPAYQRLYGIGIVIDRKGSWAPWPVFWFKDGRLDQGWRWTRAGEQSLVRLSVWLEREQKESVQNE